jgi:HPt (histidine-containing phosphotransfer) domain-containing protein
MSILKHLLAVEEAVKVNKIKYSKKRVKSSTGFKKLNTKKLLHDGYAMDDGDISDRQLRSRERNVGVEPADPPQYVVVINGKRWKSFSNPRQAAAACATIRNKGKKAEVITESSGQHLRARLAELEAMMKEIPYNPQNEEGFKARDEIRDEISDIKKQLKQIGESSSAVNIPEIVEYLERFKDQIKMLPPEQAKQLIEKKTKLYFYHQIWSIDKDEWDNNMDNSQKNAFVDAVYRRLQK